MSAVASATGVLPAPPSVKLPMHTTGAEARCPRRCKRICATAPYIAPAGASKRAAIARSRHQNEGSRIAFAALETNLHEVWLDRGYRAIERAAQSCHGLSRGGHDRGSLMGILQPRSHSHGEPAYVGYLLGSMRVVERGIDFRKVRDVWPMQDGRPQFDRFDRILAAMACKRAADENDRSHPINQPEFSNRVGDVDFGRRLR